MIAVATQQPFFDTLVEENPGENLVICALDRARTSDDILAFCEGYCILMRMLLPHKPEREIKLALLLNVSYALDHIHVASDHLWRDRLDTFTLE